MSEAKPLCTSQINLPFPYPMIGSGDNKIWPFKEEGFLLVQCTLNKSQKLVSVNDVASIFALIKMGFFGFNSNKELNNFFLMENVANQEKISKQNKSNYMLGCYVLHSVEIPSASQKFENDINVKQEENLIVNEKLHTKTPMLESLKLSYEEAYFLSYVFGLLVVLDENGMQFSLKELWNHFCINFNENDFLDYPTKYAAFHHFRSHGWIVRNGFKFGTDYLLYKEGPPFYHAKYSVLVQYEIEETDRKIDKSFKWNEISALNRVTKNSRKDLLICTVSVPSNIVPMVKEGPKCIQDFTVNLIHINRWNATKGEFDPCKLFHNEQS